jgi:DNA-binding SARP family transcriptional activator
MTLTLHIRLLGEFSLVYGDASGSSQMMGVGSARLQSLLAYLALYRHAPHPRSHIAFLFWPDKTEAQARNNLRYTLHQLRRALPEADHFIHCDAQALRWRPDAAFTLDVADFESAMARAEQVVNQTEIREALETAVALYQGDLMPGCYDDWIAPERERLREMFIGGLERLSQLLENQGEYGQAINCARRLLRHDALHEAAFRHLMQLYSLSGNRASALRAYHACATILQRELGVEPSLVTRQAYERLLNLEAGSAPLVQSSGALVGVSPLVGREQEWARLQSAWRSAASGQPHMALLVGEAGIGKTRLGEELLQWISRKRIATASARCYAVQGALAFAPVVAWLRARPAPQMEQVWLCEIARLLPDLLVRQPDLPRPAPLTEPWQRQRLFEALARAILVSQPLLLMIDDLQWCDRDTFEWLSYLLHYEPQARLLIVGMLRPEEIGAEHPLAASLAALGERGQLTEIELGPLNEANTWALAQHVANRELEPALAELLYQESEGNPLFVVEMVRAGLARDGPWSAGQGHEAIHATQPLPPRVRQVIEARLARLSPQAHQVARLAATIGREFDFRVLSKATDEDEGSLVRALDELWQRRIVREHGADGYDFCHDKIREVSYAGLSHAHRRLLHRRVAGAMEAIYAADPEAVSAQLAHHYEQAGLLERAVLNYQRSAEVSQRIYANQDAIVHLQRALALIATASPTQFTSEQPRVVEARLRETLGDLLSLIGQQSQARGAYQATLAQPPDDRIWQARLHRKLGRILDADRVEAWRCYDMAEAALGSEPPEAASAYWYEWIAIQLDRTQDYYRLGHVSDLEQLLDKIRPVVERWGTPAQVSPSQLRLPDALAAPLENAIHAWDQGRPKAALICLQQTLEPARKLGYL